ncbi:MAG: prepilin peptidase [Verrucomicrobia bacterium]|nr:prepilin peptidase [Verrucomicrobiota bacterium]
MSELSLFWSAYLSTCVVILGACIGSFLNVCIFRIPLERSIVKPRSSCPACGHTIAWYDNVPVISYLILRGKCRNCAAAISPRYVLVEALTAAIFTLIWCRYGMSTVTGIYWLAAGGLLLATFVDLEHMIIPDRVSLGGIAAGLILSVLVPQLHGAADRFHGLQESAIGAFVGAGLLWVVAGIGKAIFKKDAMGMGDIKLLAAIGAFMGWRGVLFTVMISSLIGSIVGILLILGRKREWQTRIPYGPFLAIAAIVWILWGDGWWEAYVNWLAGEYR